MKDQELFASRFSAEVDRILEQHGRAEDEGPPPEYGAMLALAEELAALDFSGDSQVRRPLRRRLMTQLEERILARQRPARWRRLLLPKPRRVLGALVGLMALVVLVGWTPAGRAVAQAVGNLVLELRWPHTTVQRVSPNQRPTVTVDAQDQFEAELAAGRAWEFIFEGREFNGCCSHDVKNEVVSLSQALEEAGFALQIPNFLPHGYALSEVRLLDTPPYHVFLIYEGPDGRLGLYQFLVGVISEEHPGDDTAVIESRAVGVVTDGMVEQMTIGTTQAALINGERLVWEEDGISFHLIGAGLGPETLVRIAESLTPAR